MFINYSPWLYQLNRVRPADKLEADLQTDVAIIGGGIAGVATAYYTLRDTNKKVALIEGYKIAHGATGHNAGQVVSYFERPLAELVDEFGMELAGKGQAAIDGAWTLLEDIISEAKLKTPLEQFTGYAGFTTLDQVLHRLADTSLRADMGLSPKPIMVAEEAGVHQQIPEEYQELFMVLPQRDIMALLETNDPKYIALMSSRKGVMNSALFCEELIGYLLAEYKHRFTLAEYTPVNRLVLKRGSAVLETEKHTVTAEKVVLCTNGFENIHIVNEPGVDIDGRYHEQVEGVVGYMAGYLESFNKNPIASCYFAEHHLNRQDPYFYLTRRPYEDEDHQRHNLVCIGGPEQALEDKAVYNPDRLYPKEAQAELDKTLHEAYAFAPKGEIKYQFQWHGLMGYTKNGVRLIGTEPCNDALMYNLGCNGVGILPSIYGGKRVAGILGGLPEDDSIFNIHDSRCMINTHALEEEIASVAG